MGTGSTFPRKGAILRGKDLDRVKEYQNAKYLGHFVMVGN